MEAQGMPRVYQDFEPSMEWVPEDDSDTLLLYLPGFAKEQLRVQLRSRNLIISGERKLQQNTWSRFRVEFPVSINCDLNKISAKFEGNVLFIRQPKLITVTAKPEEESLPAIAAAPIVMPEKLVDDPNMSQNAHDAKTSPTTGSNMENKEIGKDQEVPKMGVEEKSEKSEEKASESKISTLEYNKSKKAVFEELDKTAKTALENYKQAVAVFVTKLKTSRNTVNMIVILLVGLVLSVYLASLIKSSTKA